MEWDGEVEPRRYSLVQIRKCTLSEAFPLYQKSNKWWLWETCPRCWTFNSCWTSAFGLHTVHSKENPVHNILPIHLGPTQPIYLQVLTLTAAFQWICFFGTQTHHTFGSTSPSSITFCNFIHAKTYHPVPPSFPSIPTWLILMHTSHA